MSLESTVIDELKKEIQNVFDALECEDLDKARERMWHVEYAVDQVELVLNHNKKYFEKWFRTAMELEVKLKERS